MTAEERSELRVVLRALHECATRAPRDNEESEQRGKDYGPPSWHEGIDLWTRALAITEPNEDDPGFETAWRALVNRARAFVVMTAQQDDRENNEK